MKKKMSLLEFLIALMKGMNLIGIGNEFVGKGVDKFWSIHWPFGSQKLMASFFGWALGIGMASKIVVHFVAV
jgi:hypothetical protein